MSTSSFYKRSYTSLLTKTQPNPSRQPEILRLCKLGSLHEALKLINSSDPHKISLKPVVYASLLQTCIKAQSFTHGLQLHSNVIKSGLDTDRFVGNSLLSMYFKLGRNFSDTQRVFDNLLERDVISWTSMISGYVRIGKAKESLKVFGEMSRNGVESNAFTLSSVIKACSELGFLKLGTCFHGVVLVRGFGSNHVISSALIDMYGRNFSPEEVRRLFDEMPQPDAICWTTVISAFTRNDLFEEALRLFYVMQREYKLFADEFTFGSILTACGNLGRVRQGKEVHGKLIASGISGNVVVESSLVDMYGKCGLVMDSHRVFDKMPTKNAFSWCALLGTYCNNGDFNAVLRIFRKMEIEGNLYSFGTVLRACAGLAAVRQGKEIHCQYLRKGGWRDVIVESALVDLYAKCGCINYAHQIFSEIPVRNLITWNSMICGFAQNGYSEEALKMFNKMVDEGIDPDYISFIGVLSACSHTGLVEQGREYFSMMDKVCNIKRRVEHYNCMVDLLGRAGLVEESEDLLKNSEFCDNSSLLTALLGACTAHSNLNVAERVAKKLMELEPENHLSYVLLANVYNAVGQWGDAQKLRRVMEERAIKKNPGKSWIDIKNNRSYQVAASAFLETHNSPIHMA